MISHTSSTLCGKNAAEIALAQFLQVHWDALCYSALLLGGSSARKRAEQLICDIQAHGAISRRTRRELAEFHRLLTGPLPKATCGGPEGQLPELDPSSPIADEICLLGEDLTKHLQDIIDVSGPGDL